VHNFGTYVCFNTVFAGVSLLGTSAMEMDNKLHKTKCSFATPTNIGGWGRVFICPVGGFRQRNFVARPNAHPNVARFLKLI
jgi:hypothetical protein